MDPQLLFSQLWAYLNESFYQDTFPIFPEIKRRKDLVYLRIKKAKEMERALEGAMKCTRVIVLEGEGGKDISNSKQIWSTQREFHLFTTALLPTHHALCLPQIENFSMPHEERMENVYQAIKGEAPISISCQDIANITLKQCN